MTISRERPIDRQPDADPGPFLRTVDEAEGYVASICFKTGPPRLVGTELEWLVHHRADPARPLDPGLLRDALGPHAPPTLHPGSPHRPLPRGSSVTVEPGGQVEISTPPQASLAALRGAVDTDLEHLTALLDRAGLTLDAGGLDAHRRPARLLSTPRYDAMAGAFDREGPDGLVMMCSTAGLQVCLDAGEPHRIAARWSAVHAVGPVLLAVFANSRHHAGGDTGWASARMRTWFAMRPDRTRPVDTTDNPALAWARYAMRAPLLCVRRPHGPWHAPPDVTFAEWIGGALPRRPTIDDLRLHLSTLFPPVRPRGYLEVRYLDTQRPREWIAPVAALAALLATETTVDAALDICAPAEGRWTEAARYGLAAPVLAVAARQVLDLACRSLEHTGLPVAARDHVARLFDRRLAGRVTDRWEN